MDVDEKIQAMMISKNRQIYRWDFEGIERIPKQITEDGPNGLLILLVNVVTPLKQYFERPLMTLARYRVESLEATHEHLDFAHRVLYAMRPALREEVPHQHLDWLFAYLDFPFYDRMRERYGNEYKDLPMDRFNEEVIPAFMEWNEERDAILEGHVKEIETRSAKA